MLKIGDYTFNGPYKLNKWDPPYRAAIYAIVTKTPSNTDKCGLIYIDESSNLSEKDFKSHSKFNCWIYNADSVDELYIATYLMANCTKEQRQNVKSNLINRFNPPCND